MIPTSPPDPRVRRFLLPSRVLWQNAASGSVRLLVNNWGQALADAVPGCVLGGADAGVLLDFGRELNGSVQLVTGPIAGNKTVRARLRLGESASEAMGEPNQDHANHDIEIRLSPMASQEYGLSGFRFARLDLLDDIEVPLAVARAVTLELEPEEIGAFECSDERLNAIWKTGRETVRLCLQDFLWDGIKRDRLVWMGDLHPEVAVVLSCYGALDIVPRSLDWVRDHTPLPGWMNGIGSYSLWWIILQRDWWMHTGDHKYLQAQKPYLLGLLPQLFAMIGEDGRVAWAGMEFLDWPSSVQPEAVSAGLHALLSWGLQSADALLQVLEEDEVAAQCRSRVALLKQSAPALSPGEKAAISGSKQSAALLSLAGLRDAREANAQVLAREPLEGLSTFYGFYVLEARAQAGDMGGALDVIRNYWGAMLDLGATTFWEHWEPSWSHNAGRIDELPVAGRVDVHREYGGFCFQGLRHSLCHGWAAGPTAFLMSHVLGISIMEPGAARVAVRPDLGDLDWAQGQFPTPRGPIRVRHEKRADGRVHSEIQAPPGIEIVRGS